VWGIRERVVICRPHASLHLTGFFANSNHRVDEALDFA
jgi:hypothetical protein